MAGNTEAMLRDIESVLTAHLGPIGPITLKTQIKNLGLAPEQLGPDHMPVLVEQIGEAVTALLGDVKGKNLIEKLNVVVQNNGGF